VKGDLNQALVSLDLVLHMLNVVFISSLLADIAGAPYKITWLLLTKQI